MTTAGLVHEAATLMRDRATASARGAWGDRGWFGPDAAETILRTSPAYRREDAEHMASWSPDVAVLVAAWLKVSAGFVAESEAADGDMDWEMSHAIAVARAYLAGAK